MRTLRGQEKRMRAAALFTDAEVRAIRRADTAGLASRKEQALTYGVGKATIDRICRGETYYWVAEEDELRGRESGAVEPTAEEITASLQKLQGMLAEEGKGDKLVKEMKNDTH